MERVVPARHLAMTQHSTTTLPPATAEYVLPVPPRPAGEVVVVGSPHDPAIALRRGGEVARTLGDHFLALAECQQLFCSELRERLQQLDTAIAEATRAQLKGAVRDVLHVLDWVDSVQADFAVSSRRAAAGAEPVDVADVCAAIAAQSRALQRQVDVAGALVRPWWGEAAALHEVVRAGVALVVERTGGVGAIRILVEEGEQGPQVCVASSAEPVDGVDAASVVRFRTAVERIGGRVRPDAMGPGGAGMVIELPASE